MVIDNYKNLVNFVSWNCKGLNGAVKRGNILAHLKKLGTDIGYLQETHLRKQDHQKLRGGWIGQVFHFNFTAKNRGSAIIIKKGIPFIKSKVLSDLYGRYIIVTGKLYNNQVTLANIYAPNVDDADFIKSFISSLPNMDTHKLIIGGDFNFVLDSSLDRSSQRLVSKSKSVKIIQEFMKTYKLTDPFRAISPNSKQFSFFSSVHHTYSRIDFFLIDHRFLTQIQSCDYKAIV